MIFTSRNTKIVLGIVLFLFLVVVITSGETNKPEPVIKEVIKEVVVTPTPAPEPTISDEMVEFENLMRTTYVEGCVSEDATHQYCNCTFTELRKDYSLAEIAAMGTKYSETGTIPTEMMRVVLKCQ